MARRPFALNIDLNRKPEDKSIFEFLSHLSMMDDSYDKVKKLHDFAVCLEDEHKRLAASRQHFPNCMQLLRDAMEMCQNEELMCMVRVGMEEHTLHERNASARDMSIINDETQNWFNTGGLWTTLDFFDNRQFINLKYDVGGQIGNLPNKHVYENGLSMTMSLNPIRLGPFISGSSILSNMMVQLKGIEYNPNFVTERPRKKRRNWDTDLHKKFMSVVETLGGLREAKPKNIQKLMQVEDLTTEEIKSHLQRIREIVGSRAHHHLTASSTQSTNP